MGIPLNIDWQQILLHIFNLLILVGGLYLLLYKPVKDFMEKRRSYYAGTDAAAKAEKAAAEEEKQQYAKRLEAAEAEIDEMKKAALESARQTAAQYMKEAEAERQALLQKTQKEAEAERRKLRARANAEIGEMVSEAIDKALASRDADPVDDFIGKAKKGA